MFIFDFQGLVNITGVQNLSVADIDMYKVNSLYITLFYWVNIRIKLTNIFG